MLSNPSETKYAAGGESQNTNCLNTCLCFLFLLSVLSTSIYCTKVYKSLYEFICQGLSLFLLYRNTLDLNIFDLKSLFSSWKSLLLQRKRNKYWGCGYRIFITFWGYMLGTDVNGQSARSCHPRHGTWALFGINSFKCQIILAANQVDSCYKMTF